MKQDEPPRGLIVEEWVAEVSTSGPAELREWLEAVQNHSGIRAVVIDMTSAQEPSPRITELEQFVSDFSLPLVLALDGDIKGWAAGILLAVHICFADENSVIEFDEDSDLSAYIGRVNEPGLASRVFSAGSAVELGIVNRIPGEISALGAARDTAALISHMAPLAVRACLAAVGEMRSSIDEGLKNEALLFSALFDSKDMKRGTNAFLERARPLFEGN